MTLVNNGPSTGMYPPLASPPEAGHWYGNALVAPNSELAPILVTDAIAAADGLRRVLGPDYQRITWHGDLLFVNYMDGNPGYDGLTTQIVESRQERYKAEGLLHEHAAPQDSIRGPHVEMLAHVDPSPGRAVDSLRKVHETDEGLEGLPSFAKFASQDKFSAEGLDFLRSRAKGRPTVEIAALWKDPEFTADTKFALYREAVQDAVARRELFFMGVVAPEYAALRRAWGDSVVHRIGDPARVDGEDAIESVRLYPVVIDPLTFFDELITESKMAEAEGDTTKKYLREIMLWYFLDGLDRSLLSEETNMRIRELQDV